MQIRGVVGVAVTLVLLAGCTSAPPTTAPTDAASPSAPAVTDLVDGDTLRPEAVQALRTRFAALPSAAQEQEVADLDSVIERELWNLSGLEAELGDVQTADDTFVKANTAIRRKLAEAGGAVTSKVRIGRKGVVLPADALSEANGASLFGGLVVAGLSSAAAADVVDGKTTGSQTEKGITRSVTRTTGTLAMHTSTVIDGVEIRIDTNATVQPCPDASGSVVASVTASGATNKAGTGVRYSYHVDLAIQVGDDAEITGRTVDFRAEQSEYSPNGRRFVDVAVTGAGAATVKRGVGDVTGDFVSRSANAALMMGELLAGMATRAAQDKWLSGACVTLKPTVSSGPGGVRPGASVSIVAAPRAKADGASTGGTVTAQLADGEGSVTPTGTKVPADATFTYVAPNAPEKTGTVALESRSRRGVGKASIRFDTYPLSFAAEGGAAEFHGTGRICDLREPFTISGTGLRLSFTPADQSSGSYVLSGKAGGATWSGGGSYTVSLNESGNSGKLVTSGVNTITAAGRKYSADAEAVFTLRQVAGCGG